MASVTNSEGNELRSLRTQLSLAIMLVVLVAVALISFFANSLIARQFESYIAKQQKAKSSSIAENLSQYYNGFTNSWDLNAIHALGMYSLGEGYIVHVTNNHGENVWDAENHDMGLCQETMTEIETRMEAHGATGTFSAIAYDLTQKGQKIGTASVKYYGPFFMSESEFSFMGALNVILVVIGILSLLLACVVGWFMAKRFVRPLDRVTDIAVAIAKGQYDVQFEGKTDTKELHDLVSAINHLSDALAKQEKLRKQLTADVAHELRTPLTTLGTHLECMVSGVWEATPERLNSCHEEILRIGNMVADLERLERVESENLIIEKVPIDLLTLVKTVCDNFAGQLANKNQQLEISGVETIALVDKDRMGGVITNLVSNAVKYTPEGGRIYVFVKPLDVNTASLVVEDTGPGIPAAELPFIFERFYRADKSRNRGTGGAGIGLAIVNAVVAAHGGSVTAETLRGKGARFTVIIPG
jgi:signal transduction histidine kinase